MITPASFVDAAEAVVRRRTGLVFREFRREAFETGLMRALDRGGPMDPAVYLARLEAESELLDDLIGEITVGETYFFRDAGQFGVIRDEIVPALLSESTRGDRIRMWSAGCATGEEAYSLAIVAHERGLARTANVVGTDLSRGALAAAGRAVYARWSFRGVPEDIVHNYFEPVRGRLALAPAVRSMVEFRYLNLAEDVYPSLSAGIWGMDLILCRNVLIYFDWSTVADVARRLVDSLSDDGWLLLGASDPPLGDVVPCEVVVTEAGLAYRRRGRRRSGRVLPLPPPGASAPSLPAPPPSMEPAAAPRSEVAVPSPDAAQAYRGRDYERAAELAGRRVESDAADHAHWIILVRALANIGDLPAAGRACAAALDRHRASAELSYLHALLLGEAAQHAGAAAAARRALYLDRGLVVAHLALGAALARLNDAVGARRALGNAERLLSTLPPEAVVPASDGEPAGRLLEMTRVQMRLVGGAAA